MPQQVTFALPEPPGRLRAEYLGVGRARHTPVWTPPLIRAILEPGERAILEPGEECVMAKDWRCLIGLHDWREVQMPDRDKCAECTRCGKRDWRRLLTQTAGKWRGGDLPPGTGM